MNRPKLIDDWSSRHITSIAQYIEIYYDFITCIGADEFYNLVHRDFKYPISAEHIINMYKIYKQKT